MRLVPSIYLLHMLLSMQLVTSLALLRLLPMSLVTSLDLLRFLHLARPRRLLRVNLGYLMRYLPFRMLTLPLSRVTLELL